MKKIFCSIIALAAMYNVNAQSNKKLEKDLIKSLAGIYKVEFKFGETFASNKDYKYFDKKFDWGIEYVEVIEESENKISLQHLLIVNDSMIIKHWRQDWVFENNQLLSYVKDNHWKKETIPAEKVKGTWTQKVYQVEDGPRYEGYGTWVHVDGRHYWESTADAPLPRREMTTRKDYNVLNRQSHIEIFKDGTWVLEQDNKKVIRTDDKDSVICLEKGIEFFHKTTESPQPAIKYWTEQKEFWKDVRATWETTLAKYNEITIKNKVDKKRLYEALFELGDTYSKAKKYDSVGAKKAIQAVLDIYVEGK